jgi:hypothetical protein
MRILLVLPLLFATITAIRIECHFEISNAWSHFDWLYSCDVTKIELTGSTSIQAVTGTHKYGKTYKDVKLIKFSWPAVDCSHLHFIPQNIDRYFKNIIGLAFYFCKLKDLTGDELKDLHNLEWFSVHHDPIDRIPGNLFENNRKLRFVSFYSDNITKVGPDLLSGLEHLEMVDFRKNACIDEEFKKKNRTGVGDFVEKLRQKCPDVRDPSSGPTFSVKILIIFFVAFFAISGTFLVFLRKQNSYTGYVIYSRLKFGF